LHSFKACERLFELIAVDKFPFERESSHSNLPCCADDSV
jgi:hypothetical protein